MIPGTSEFDAPPGAVTRPITADVPCCRCGYNLRGLREEMACPECGTAVGLSTKGEFLRYADPAWVETIARGATVIVWSILAQFAAMALGMWAVSATGDTLILTLLSFGVSLVTGFGVWRLTTRDQGQSGREPSDRARRLARVTLIVQLAISTITIASAGLSPGRGKDVFVLLLSCAVGLIAAASMYFLYLHIQHLAGRVPDDLLSRRAGWLRRAFVASCVPVVIVQLATGIHALAQGNRPNRVVTDALQLTGGILGLVTFTISIISVFFLVRFARRLREQAASARRIWSADAALPQAG